MRRIPSLLSALLLVLLCLLCASCGKRDDLLSPQDDPNEGLGGDFDEDAGNDFSEYEGIWLGDAGNDYDYIEFDDEGNWTLYVGNDVADDGYLRYEPEWSGVYAYSNWDDSGSRTELQGDQLYLTSYGYFNYGGGMEYLWYDDGKENDGRLTEDDEPYIYDDGENGRTDEYWSKNADLYQRNVSEFKGVWYYDGDLAAETYIVIDGDGNWSYYQRAPGAEAAEMDHGILSYSTDEASTYYADSVVYDGVSYKVFEFDADVLIWGDEGAYYLMEQS